MSSVIDRIRSLGHWEVWIRPATFVVDRMPYSGLLPLLERAVVRMRGWPVPMIDGRQDFARGKDWIGQDIDADVVAHAESWRFYQSGQFGHLRVVSADLRQGSEATPVPSGAASVIEVWEILFYLTEVVELAARLAASDAGDERMVLDIALHRMEGRQLVSTPERDLHGMYRAGIPTITATKTVERDRLLAHSRQIAVELAGEFFHRFGAPLARETLADYQQELTSYR